MRILIIINGEYGQRHADNIRAHKPDGWEIEVWKAPKVLPPVIDDPEDFLPPKLPPADLILSLAEHPGVATLLPDVATMTGARSVLAPVDSTAWLPNGLAAQVEGWLQKQGVAFVSPKPFCSLTETTFNVLRKKRSYDDPLIAEFARHFGRPKFEITCDPDSRQITQVTVLRDASCGCARYVAEKLIGVAANDAEQESGMLHHHYPCQAAMGVDDDYADTLLHASGHIMQEEVVQQVSAYRQVQYVVPGVRSEA
ncbi:MAG: hypothetical protein JW850_04220 [Thermoflexales bacterium]|nr:hypothetical protein [Thermoflexales bacterium]